MTLSVSAFARLSRSRLPAALLVTLLQRTPAVRLFVAAGDYVVTSPLGQLLRGGLTAAVLGAMHSRAGATTFLLRQGTTDVLQFGNDGRPTIDKSIVGTVGQQLTPVSFTYIISPSAPIFFQIVG